MRKEEDMESHDFSPPHVESSRPSIGLPLGTALLLIVIFCLSGFVYCCYHWDKLRSLRRRSFSEDSFDPEKSKPSRTDLNKVESQSLPVIMPGDKIPRFIAMPCPCEPLRLEKIVIKVQKPPRVPVPLYL